jgi:hypothetical protein
MPMTQDPADYNRLSQTSDGFGFKCDGDPTKMVELVTGGPVAALFTFAQAMHQVLNELAGNLPALAGLGPQAKTLGQDQIINSNASRGVQDMQEDAVNYTADVCKRLLWLWWNHPQKVMKSRYRPESMPELGRTLRVYPGHFPQTGSRGQPVRTRRGGMPKLTVAPYSLVHKTPQQRWAFLKQLVADLMPLMPLLQQQGVQFDAQAYLRLGRKYNDEPDVSTLFTIATPPQPQPGGQDAGPAELLGGAGGDKTTTIERRSLGDSSGQKRKADLVAEMMGGGSSNGHANGRM